MENTEKNEWIPVTERLPDAEVEVLTWSEGGDLRVSARDEKGCFWSRCMDSCGCCDGYDQNITHWRPMLEGPPKAGE